jgi:hypothetical protein
LSDWKLLFSPGTDRDGRLNKSVNEMGDKLTKKGTG